MNFVYGALAIVISLIVVNVCKKPNWSKPRIFIQAFIIETLLIMLLGGVFYIFELGFFANAVSNKEILLRIVGFSVFLGILVGLKAQNRLAEE